ncbi:unnamed protein product, partial [Fusarium graminearum]
NFCYTTVRSITFFTKKDNSPTHFIDEDASSFPLPDTSMSIAGLHHAEALFYQTATKVDVLEDTSIQQWKGCGRQTQHSSITKVVLTAGACISTAVSITVPTLFSTSVPQQSCLGSFPVCLRSQNPHHAVISSFFSASSLYLRDIAIHNMRGDMSSLDMCVAALSVGSMARTILLYGGLYSRRNDHLGNTSGQGFSNSLPSSASLAPYEGINGL